MKLLALITLPLFLMSCASNAPFYQVNCDYESKDIFNVRFENDEDVRDLMLNPNENVVIFKGTTFRDLKWASNLDKVGHFEVNKKGNLQIVRKSGVVQEVGKVNTSCQDKIKSVLGEYFVSSN